MRCLFYKCCSLLWPVLNYLIWWWTHSYIIMWSQLNIIIRPFWLLTTAFKKVKHAFTATQRTKPSVHLNRQFHSSSTSVFSTVNIYCSYFRCHLYIAAWTRFINHQTSSDCFRSSSALWTMIKLGTWRVKMRESRRLDEVTKQKHFEKAWCCCRWCYSKTHICQFLWTKYWSCRSLHDLMRDRYVQFIYIESQ